MKQAKTVHAALARADTELMAAHGRGDYAAMAPLARQANTNKLALAATAVDLETRLGSFAGEMQTAAVATEAAHGPAEQANMVEPEETEHALIANPAGSPWIPSAAEPTKRDHKRQLVQFGVPRLRDLIRIPSLPIEHSWGA